MIADDDYMMVGIIPCEKIPYLWTGEDSPRESYHWDRNNSKLMQIIEERGEKTDNLIVVSHYEITNAFPSYFRQQKFGGDKRMGTLFRGYAIHFDLTAKRCQLLPKINLFD